MALGALANWGPAGIEVWLMGHGLEACWAPPPPIDYLLGNTQGSPTHISPPAGQVKLLPHTRSEEAPAHTGKAWPGEADRPSLTLRGFQAAPCQGPQVIILAITTPSC